MKKAVSIAISILCISSICFAGDKGGISSKTDFKNITPREVLIILRNADRIEAIAPKGSSVDGVWLSACNGKQQNKFSGDREKLCSHNVFLAISDKEHPDPAIVLYDMQLLFRACGIYASSSDQSSGGTSCGKLGRFFYVLGNVQAARAIWEQASGCYSFDSGGSQVNGCMQEIVSMIARDVWPGPGVEFGNSEDAYKSDPQRLMQMAQEACNRVHNRYACEYLQQQGQIMDMNAVSVAEQDRREARREAIAERTEQNNKREAESESRKEAVIGSFQSMPVANDPNAIVNAGNQQASQIRAIGDANAATQQQNVQARIDAQQQAAANQRQQQANQTNSSSGNSFSNSTVGAGSTGASTGNYISPIAQGCVSEFWDAKFYNWLSFQNNCGQTIYLSWIAKNPSDTFGAASATIGAGQSTNSGWSQSEVTQKQNFALFICPAGYYPVDASTYQPIRSSTVSYVCKAQ